LVHILLAFRIRIAAHPEPSKRSPTSAAPAWSSRFGRRLPLAPGTPLQALRSRARRLARFRFPSYRSPSRLRDGAKHSL